MKNNNISFKRLRKLAGLSNITEDESYDNLGDDGEDPERKLIDLLSNLSPREAKVICMWYGIGTPRRHTLVEIGQQFSVSKARIEQIRNAAIAKIGEKMHKQNVTSFLNSSDSDDDDPYDLRNTRL